MKQTNVDAPRKRHALPSWLTVAVTGGAFVALALLEMRRPLRRQREAKGRRVARNGTLAAIAAATTSALQIPLLQPVARRVEERRLGLLHALPVPRPARVALGVLLLDYTLWWWHWLNHEVPLLWRFHLVHHVDRDMDASTALRFHFGEMALSVVFRAAQFRILGIDPLAASLWQTALLASILFHHANLELPPDIERRLVRVLVTPRMHGIHHSDVHAHTDSNWASLLSCWDMLHGTFRLDVPQEAITIGVAAWQQPGDVTLPALLAMPFRPQRDDWSR